MREIAVLALAALFEAGGDALVRWGLRDGRWIGFVLGAAVLFGYSLTVNASRWDFGRLLGVYIAVFFVVSQIIAATVFRERLHAPTFVGGALIVAGGLVLTLWKPR
ncbi:MAG TPA: hypothetical protein VFJ58_21745 [Armatimonadota bacterium]|nr:hypothetical protein [Armatimonadota bacterium]